MINGYALRRYISLVYYYFTSGIEYSNGRHLGWRIGLYKNPVNGRIWIHFHFTNS